MSRKIGTVGGAPVRLIGATAYPGMVSRVKIGTEIAGFTTWTFEGWLAFDAKQQRIGVVALGSEPEAAQVVAKHWRDRRCWRLRLEAEQQRRANVSARVTLSKKYTRVRGPVQLLDDQGLPGRHKRLSLLRELRRLWRTPSNPRRNWDPPRLEIKWVARQSTYIGRASLCGTWIRLPLWPGRRTYCVLSTLSPTS